MSGRRQLRIGVGREGPARERQPRSQTNRTPVISMWSMQVNTQQPVRRGQTELGMKQRLADTMTKFFESDELLARALKFNWEGDGMEQVHNIAVAGGSERGGKQGRIHGHYIVRILHTTNLGFANTHTPGKPGYRPEGEELVGEVLAEIWNNLVPHWNPPLRNMNVLLHRINDPMAAELYALKEQGAEMQLSQMLEFEEQRAQRIVEARADGRHR